MARRVIYTGDVADDQVAWGANDDPRNVLTPGEIYTVDRVEVHSWHTKYHIGGQRYNSVHFKDVEPEA